MKRKILKTVLLLGLLSTSTLFASESLFKSCTGCHGANGEKKALGKSKVIASMSEKEINLALNGYKNGTYGKAMKGLMKGQVAKLDEKKIKSLAKYIVTLKK